MRLGGGSRVWITGASSGIGAALVAELAGRGCRVAASARRAERLEQLAAETPGEVMPVPADVTDRTALLALDSGDGVEVISRHFDTNVMGMAHGVEAVLADMRRRRSGAIAGMASMAGYRGLPRSEAYGATKAAEINMLESLRIDLRPHGISVHTVCPGFVRTDLTAKNTFPMPFMLDADQAARRIVRGLEKGKAEIAFPLPMLVAMKTARLVPVRLWAEAFRGVGRHGTSG